MHAGTYEDACKEEKRLLNELKKGNLIADIQEGRLLPQDQPKRKNRKRKLVSSTKEKSTNKAMQQGSSKEKSQKPKKDDHKETKTANPKKASAIL